MSQCWCRKETDDRAELVFEKVFIFVYTTGQNSQMDKTHKCKVLIVSRYYPSSSHHYPSPWGSSLSCSLVHLHNKFPFTPASWLLHPMVLMCLPGSDKMLGMKEGYQCYSKKTKAYQQYGMNHDDGDVDHKIVDHPGHVYLLDLLQILFLANLITYRYI